MTGPKLNEAPVRRKSGLRADAAEAGERQGTRATARYVRISPYKAREVVDLIRGQDAIRAREILLFSERDAAIMVGKVLGSAVANAEHNDNVPEDELYVSACFVDEGPTLKRWRPRARGRATRIRKRTCHITVIVSRLPDEELTRVRETSAGARRARRAGQKAADDRRRFGRRTRRQAGDEAAAADEALAAEGEEAQQEAVEDIAAAGAEQVIAQQDATDTTEEQVVDSTPAPTEPLPAEDQAAGPEEAVVETVEDTTPEDEGDK